MMTNSVDHIQGGTTEEHSLLQPKGITGGHKSLLLLYPDSWYATSVWQVIDIKHSYLFFLQDYDQ